MQGRRLAARISALLIGIVTLAGPGFQQDQAHADDAPRFVTTWSGDSARLCLSGGLDLSINWGDGSPIHVIQESGPKTIHHTFKTTAETHQVVVTGTFGTLDCSGNAGNLLVSVDEWGETGTWSLNGAFAGSTVLRYVAEPPSTVTRMGWMFDRTGAFNQPIDHWDLSGVTYMVAMFSDSVFNQPIGSWDTSSVTEMNSMFSGNSVFDQPIGGWDTRNVAHMDWMFFEASSFNQDLSRWCVPKIGAEPDLFDYAASAWTAPRPVWGTCGSPDTTRPEGNFSWKAVNDVGRLWTRGWATDDVSVDRAQLSFQDIATGKWLRRDGTRGAYQAWPATVVDPAAASTDWKFNALLPAGTYYMRLVVIDAAGNKNRTPRPQRRVVVSP